MAVETATCGDGYCSWDQALFNGELGGLVRRTTGCDSSSCLVCQFAEGACYSSTSVPGKMCSLLRKRSVSATGQLHFQEALASTSPACMAGAPCDTAAPGKRQRVWTPAPSSSHALYVPRTARHALLFGRPLPLEWQWVEAQHSARVDPAPARLSEIVQLHYTPGATHDMICAMEFCPDGRLLASGSMSKQVRLYSLMDAVAEAREAASAASSDDAPTGQLGSVMTRSLEPCSTNSSSSTAFATRSVQQQRQQRAVSPRAPGENAYAGATDPYAPVAVQRLPSKISCLAWSPTLDGVITVGDYDGVLTQLHICSGHQLADVDAHSGRRIWGISYSPHAPHVCGTVSDDRTCRLWAGTSLESQVAVLTPNPTKPAPICGIDFSPVHEHVLALACADHQVYLYDIRATARPLATLRHHQRPVSYVKFFGGGQLVSASTDSSLAIWELGHDLQLPGWPSATQPAQEQQQQQQQRGSKHATRESPTARAARTRRSSSIGRGDVEPGSRVGAATMPLSSSHQPLSAPAAPWRVFSGHRNEKNFVGLAVRPEDGLLACGSESSRVYTYHTSWAAPLATLDFDRPLSGWDAWRAGSVGGSTGAEGSTGSALSSSSGHLAGGGEGDGLQAGGPTSGSSCFVSSVCWQPWRASMELGLPAILAAGSSRGEVRLMMLTDPS